MAANSERSGSCEGVVDSRIENDLKMDEDEERTDCEWNRGRSELVVDSQSENNRKAG